MIKVNEQNFREWWVNDFSETPFILINIDKELFQTADYGIELMRKLSETHLTMWMEGNGLDNGFTILYKSKSL